MKGVMIITTYKPSITEGIYPDDAGLVHFHLAGDAGNKRKDIGTNSKRTRNKIS